MKTTTPKTTKKLKPTFVVVSATDAQKHFSKYTAIAASGKDVLIEKNGKSIARIVAERKGKPLLTDLVGILSDQPYMTIQEANAERARNYEATGRF